MGLNLAQTDPRTGAATSYVRIDQVNLPNLGEGGVINVGFYVDKTAAATLKPVTTVELTLTPEEGMFLRQQGLALLYSILKMRTEFRAATDNLATPPPPAPEPTPDPSVVITVG